MTYILTVKDSLANAVKHLCADDPMRAFDVGQRVLKQGNEIIDIKTTSTDNNLITVDDIKESLIVKDY